MKACSINPNIDIQELTAVILVADNDFGRCAMSSDLPRALWPVGEKIALQNLIDKIAESGISKIVICSSQSSVRLSKALKVPETVDLRFHEEILPRGTAGSMQDAHFIAGTEYIMVFHAEIINPPNINKIIDTHVEGKSDMTVLFNPSCSSKDAHAYICRRLVMNYIPSEGYFDFKESLVPRLVQEGIQIYAADLEESVGGFRNWKQYLSVCMENLEDKLSERPDISGSASVDKTAVISGSVKVCDRAEISKNAVVIGPAIIGPDVKLAEGAAVSRSIIWDRASIGNESFVHNALISKDALVSKNAVVEKGLYTSTSNIADTLKTAARDIVNNLAALPSVLNEHKTGLKLVLGVFVFAVFLWSYWNNVFTDLWMIWMQSDEYSSGILVPPIALYILWLRRRKLLETPLLPSFAGGLVIFMFAQAIRIFGLFFMYASLERISMVITLISLVILMFGWKMFSRLWTVMLFLCLMLPPPVSVSNAISFPLQQWATSSAVFCLEIFGFNVLREGNVITLNGTVLAVAEACNGLRMLTSFLVISSMVALLVNRNIITKVIIVLSGIPIALLCNTIRLTLTSIAFTVLESERWRMLFHDFGGYAMMPLALLIVILELKLISNIVVRPKEAEVIVNETRES